MRVNSSAIVAGALFAGALTYTAVSEWGRNPLVGQVYVLDGDTLDMRGSRIRLVGIDAPEMGQKCTTFDGEVFDCGVKARVELIDFIARREVVCVTRGLDTYRRILALCTVDGHDLGRFMVTRGWAFAYGDSSYRYTSDERMATAERTGIHATFHDQPAQWRRTK